MIDHMLSAAVSSAHNAVMIILHGLTGFGAILQQCHVIMACMKLLVLG